MRALSLDLGAQLLFHLRITELAARVDECSHCGIAPQLYCKRQILERVIFHLKYVGTRSWRYSKGGAVSKRHWITRL